MLKKIKKNNNYSDFYPGRKRTLLKLWGENLMNANNKVLYVKDTVKFKTKPTFEQAGSINSRLAMPKNQKKATIKEMISDSLLYSIAPIEIKKDHVGNLSEDCFKSQQVFMFDIDNTVETINKEKGKKGDKKKAPAKMKVDLEQFLKICSNVDISPVYVAYTHSHSEEHPRMRAAFVLEEPVYEQQKEIMNSFNRLLNSNGYAIGDQRCLKPNRFFYPCKKVCYENYSARISADTVIKKAEGVKAILLKYDDENKYYVETEIKHYKKNNSFKSALNPDSIIAQEYSNNPSHKNKEKNISNCAYNNSNYDEYRQNRDLQDFYELVSQLPMDEILGQKEGKPFLCLFHKEKNHSAYIRKDPDTGKWWYYCFGCGYHGDNFNVLSRYHGMSTFETIEYIKNNFGINMDEYQAKSLEVINKLIYDLEQLQKDERLQQKYKVLYKKIKSHINKLVGILNILKTKIPPVSLIDDKDVVTITASIRYLHTGLSCKIKGCKRYGEFYKYLQLFIKLGFLERISEELINELLLSKLQEPSPDLAKRHITLYRVPRSDQFLFKRANDIAKSMDEQNYKTNAICRDTELSLNGDEEAGRIYTQDIGRGTTEKYDAILETYTRAALKILKRNGYIYEKKLFTKIESIFANMSKVGIQKCCDRCLPVLLKEHNMERVRVNKGTRGKYKVNNKIPSNSLIIVKKAAEEEKSGELRELPQKSIREIQAQKAI